MLTNGKIQLYPFLRLALFLIVGIVVGEACTPAVSARMWGVMAVVCLVGIAALFRRPIAQSAAILLCTAVLGALRVSVYHALNDRTLPEGQTTYTALVTGEPSVRGKVLRCDLLVLDGEAKGLQLKASILRDTVEERYRQLHAGSTLRATSMLEAPRNFFPDSNFDYARWLYLHGFQAQTFVFHSSWTLAATSPQTIPAYERFKLALYKYRQRLLERYQQSASTFDDDTYGVVAAMTLGDKSALSKDLKETYSITGASHILALSGLHLSIIYFVLSLVLVRRRWFVAGQLAVVVAIWGFAFLVGMMPSVVRAATMMTVYALVAMLYRQRVSLNTLSIAAFVMLLANPMVLYDAGFQMSFAAVLGIIVFYEPFFHFLLTPRWMRRRIVRWLTSLVCTSLAAQLTTAPLVAFYFGRFSCYFLLTNLVAIPLATVIIYGALALLLLSSVPVVGAWLGWGVFSAATLLNSILGAMARWPGASIEHISVSLPQLVLIYILLACAYCLAHYAKKMYYSYHGLRMRRTS